MSKRTIIFIVIGAVLVAIFFAVRSGAQNAQAALLGDLQTEEISTGSLESKIGGTGTVRANQSAWLTWGTSGTVDDVNVAVGDEVTQGQNLANLTQASLPQAIILATADLYSAEQALEDLYEQYADLGIAQALKAVADARDAVRDAQTRVNGLQAPTDPTTIDEAFAQLVLAESQLNAARTAYSFVENLPDTNVKRAQAFTALQAAQDAYNSALRSYNYATGTADDLEIAKAEADLAVAEANLVKLEAEYEDILNGPEAAEIAAAEARIAAAKATLALAEINAPFAGTVTAAEPKAGDQVTTGSRAFRVDDLSRLLVDVNISEVDINQVALGQPATIIFDAVLAKEYTGQVVGISLAGESEGGLVNFKVTVELVDADELVRPGMTAAVNIVVSQLEDVLLVPNRAVRVFDGERVVYVLRNGQVEQIVIELGATSDTHSEVLAGDLEAGDAVILNPPSQGFGPPGGGPRGGGPGGN